MYDCEDYLPFLERVFYLAGVKEAIGYIPFDVFKPSHDEILALIILSDEKNKKQSEQLAQSQREAKSKSPGSTPQQPKSPMSGGSHRKRISQAKRLVAASKNPTLRGLKIGN